MTFINRKITIRSRGRGVTLVELLVVLAIISFLTAILIPRIRIINKDRGIRESARVVASTFAKVSSRAIDEKVAGILIERNPNFVDAAGVTFGATTMYVLRALPPYGGDEQFDPTLTGNNRNGALVTSSSASTMVVSIPIPLEHTLANPLVQANDYIRLNYSSVQYRIINDPVPSALPNRMDVTLSLGNGFGVLPALSLTGAGPGVPYLIYRKPQKLESSRIDLPSGYVIDLRYSGPISTRPPATNTGTVFNQVNPDTIELMYDDHGAVERIYYTEPGPPPARVSVIPLDTIYFFVADVEADPTVLPIYQPGNMWVTLERASGSANVAYNAPPPTGLPLDQQVETARTLAANRLSALQ